MAEARLITVTPDNLEKAGFFCYMSKRGSEGHRMKEAWLHERFKEGLNLKVYELPTRGFIEYLPGGYAWRSIYAEEYMVIHCIWIVGQSKGEGHGTRLLNEALKDAKAMGLKGVATVTSEGTWLAGKKLFEKHGFETADRAAPSFRLMVKRFGKADLPKFTGDWERKAREFGEGFTVLYAHQCPYQPDAIRMVEEMGHFLHIPVKSIDLRSAEEVREYSPSPYGTFCIIYNGKVLSHSYLRGGQFQAAMAKMDKRRS